jgi:hypothetical protein
LTAVDPGKGGLTVSQSFSSTSIVLSGPRSPVVDGERFVDGGGDAFAVAGAAARAVGAPGAGRAPAGPPVRGACVEAGTQSRSSTSR